MKKIIRLTESDLHRIVKESVNRILEANWSNALTDPGQEPDEDEEEEPLSDIWKRKMEDYEFNKK